MTKPNISIIGAGKLGIVLAQLATKAGYTVRIASSRPASNIALTIRVLAPGAIAADSTQAIVNSDIVILALPLSKFRNLDPALFENKLIIDAMNYWFEVDGPRSDTIPDVTSSSEAVQQWFADARVVKALSHMGYHELHDMTLPSGSKGRKAIAIAGNNDRDIAQVTRFVDDLGFEPLVLGDLSTGLMLEPGQIGFGASLQIHQLQALLRAHDPS